ncbi:RNA polymerase sigma factor [Sphingomonas arantia]|uniref:RNA polymerase sigma factor n=1 Tax=Sphingomonas arantia TaxID=1460676 RepID=A0ABW4TZA2_9SPHN
MLAEWVGREILPHERELRVWLARRVVAAADMEDVVQECYCRLAQLSDVSHILTPRAYLFTMARNILRQQRQRTRVVRIEPLSDELEATLEGDLPSPERAAMARQELARVQSALATLPERARRIFMMRRVDGLSQKDIASRLGVSESIVENEASRSLRAILKSLTGPPADDDISLAAAGGSHARSR